MVPLFERHQHFYVSVNIPPAILGSGQILPMVEELQLTPYLSRIVCELTERQALTSVGRSALKRARNSGMSIAIDDFGTGHSGLMQIVGLDFDILKIDHSLIRHDSHEPNGGENAARHRSAGRGAASSHRC